MADTGYEIGCVSTGIGTTSAEICIHELCNIGVETAIRIGTTGSISPRFAPGDLIIPVAAIRADGTSDCYIDRSFPAVANLDVVNALGEACEHLGFRYGYGIMYSPSSLYIGQGRKLSEQGYWPSSAQHLIDDLRQARVTNIDTDSAGQFVVGYLHNMRMASILSVITNRLDNTWSTDDSSERRACRAACELCTSCSNGTGIKVLSACSQLHLPRHIQQLCAEAFICFRFAQANAENHLKH